MAEDEKFSQPGEGAQAPSPKRKAKRGWIIGGVVAAVIVVAGAGFWVWHETPSFCNAICHSPMDSYVETYYSGDQGMLVTAHAEAGNNCLSCHEPVITEQVGEVMKWVADDYPMTADGAKLADGADMASEEFCAKSGCHDMDDVVASTSRATASSSTLIAATRTRRSSAATATRLTRRASSCATSATN